jgi:hypothetical protein
MFWKGKTKRGEERMLRIELDNKPKNAMVAIEVMEEILKEAAQIDIMDMLKAQKSKNSKEEGHNKWSEV